LLNKFDWIRLDKAFADRTAWLAYLIVNVSLSQSRHPPTARLYKKQHYCMQCKHSIGYSSADTTHESNSRPRRNTLHSVESGIWLARADQL